MFFIGLFIGGAIGCLVTASICINDVNDNDNYMDDEDEYYKEQILQ